MADIAGVIFSAFSCICGTPTCICIDQHRNFNDDVGELRRNLDSLTSRRRDIESIIQEAEARGGQMVKQEVEDWLAQAQVLNVDVRAFLEKVQGAKRYKHACLDKRVCRKINVMKQMLEKSSFPQGLFIERAPAHGNIFLMEDLVGEISTKEEIRGYLISDEVGMIGVCGIGGVGKTTIMRNLHNDLQKETRFQKVIWVTVSHPLNVFELQKKIASAMGRELREDQEVMMRAAALMEIMRGVRFVLILDDVWDKFSLKEVGIPEPTVQNGCKVVITSRSIEVCNRLNCTNVKVQPLSEEESLKLFLDTVGGNVLQVPGLEEILKLIVKECDGLPLAIVVIAGSMRGVSNVNVWADALTELQDCVQSVNDFDEKVLKRLKFSYDRLNDLKIQECFLYCSLFPEDYEFFIEPLMEEWIDEGLLDNLGSRQKGYNRGHTFLEKLVNNCLLEKKTVSDRWFKIEQVKMHDVVRDMAIKSVGLGAGYMVKAGMNLTKVPNEDEWVRNLKKVSLMKNKISKIPVGWSPKCPMLSTLILHGNSNLSEIPSSFFEDMVGLKVLDLSYTGIKALPDSISKMVNLSALRLQGCHKLKYLPSLVKLSSLKKLDLRDTRIKVVPQGFEMLLRLEYLDLFSSHLKKIPGKIWSNLSKLETVQCKFHDIHEFNHFSSKSKDFQSLETYDIFVNQCVTADRSYQRKVTIHGLEIGEECVVLPSNLQNLLIDECKNMKSILNKTVPLEKANELRICNITNCREIECLVELDSSYSSLCCPVLDKLEKLALVGLPMLCVLVRVEGVATPPHVFSNLKQFRISSCSGMRKLFPLELLRALKNLEEIEVSRCREMEEIIASSDSEASSDKFTLIFPKLRELRWVSLPKLKSICSGKGVMVCDSIEEIWITGCPQLKRIPVQLPPLDNGQPSPPPRLRQINMSKESKEWWESVVEWDHPNAKNILQPLLNFDCFVF